MQSGEIAIPYYYQIPALSSLEQQALASIFPRYGSVFEEGATGNHQTDTTLPADGFDGFHDWAIMVANDHQTTPDVAKGMFDQMVVEKGLPRSLLGDATVVLFDGNEGGITPGRADAILRMRPDLAVFANITGDDDATEKTKKAFYQIVNIAKQRIADPDLTDDELLNLPLEDQPDKNLLDGFFNLINKELDFEKATSTERANRISEWMMPDPEDRKKLIPDRNKIAGRIRFWSDKIHRNHGWFMRDLPEEARVKILRGMKKGTEGFVEDVFAPIQDYGGQTVLNMGNFDDPKTPDTIAQGNPTIVVPFNTASSAKKAETIVFDNLGRLVFPDNIDPTVFGVFGPFFPLRDWDDARQVENLAMIASQMYAAKEIGTTGFLAVHASPYWEAHDPSITNPQTSPSNQQVAQTARKLIHTLKPDLVIHGQLPDPKKDSHGNVLPLNNHLLTDPTRDNAPLVLQGQALTGFEIPIVHNPLRTHSVMVARPGIPMTLGTFRVLPPRFI